MKRLKTGAKPHYATLDTLRGVAALAVLGFHIGNYFLNASLFPHGYLAVDFFFILSGFVVAYSYEQQLLTGLSWRGFVVRRLIRLYPLVLLGVVMGLAVMLVKWRFYPGKAGSLPEILGSTLLNLAILPTIFNNATPDHVIFPGDDPLWSIFFEMLINLIWAYFGIRMKNWQLGFFVVCSFIILVVIGLHAHTLNLGSKLGDIIAGMARVCFGFPLGALMCRMKDRIRRPNIPFNGVILSVALLAVLDCPFNVNPAGTSPTAPWFDLVAIFIILPAITLLGIVPAKGTKHRLGHLLGLLSYPVYVVHDPLLIIAAGLRQSKLAAVNAYVFSGFVFMVFLILSFCILRFYDEPIRRRLSQRTRRIARDKVIVT
jgi:peptidoglycan/LPS O-acetylase OafA/YrhL